MQFRMKWPDTRIFPDLGEVAPGEIVEAESNPHPAFFEPVTVTAPAPPPADEGD